MKQYVLFMILIVSFVFVFTGCDGDGDGDSSEPTVPTGSLDLTGTYRFQTTLTPTSGDCSAILTNPSGTSPSGTMTFAHTSPTTFTVTSCTFDAGGLCPFIGANGTIQDSLVTLSQALTFGQISYQITMTGTVTDPSNFTLSGQGMSEPGACQFTTTGTWTRS